MSDGGPERGLRARLRTVGAGQAAVRVLRTRVVFSFYVTDAGSTALKNSFFHDTDGKVTFILGQIPFFLSKHPFHPRRATQRAASSPSLWQSLAAHAGI